MTAHPGAPTGGPDANRTGTPASWTPSLPALARQRMRLELRAFRRSREEVVFTFALPVMLLGLFAVIFGGEIADTGVDLSQYYVAGMLASTGLTVGFQSLTTQLALEQHDGTLKRLAGTPMPKAAYMVGKISTVCVIAAVQSATMFVIGVAAFGVSLPAAAGWSFLATVLIMNLAIWTFLGLATSRLIRSPRAGMSVAIPPALILQFVSGVYIPFDNIPPWLRGVASLFPLRWASLGMRRALLPDSFAAAEPGGSWQATMTLLVLAGWLIISAGLAGTLFRWKVRE